MAKVKYLGYYATKTPCGKTINENYPNDGKMESCMTICPDKDFKNIDLCADNHKAKKIDPLKNYGQEWVNVNSKDRLFSH